MVAVTYEQLALEWRPDNKRDNAFKYITAAVVVFVLLLGFILSSIEVPKEDRKAKVVVPERVAKFILKKEKPKIVKPKPKPKPKPVFKPRLREKPKKLDKPLTKKQKKARKKAEDSGLLALGNELADLMDTSDVNKMVGKRINKSSTSTKAATVNKDVLTIDAGKGSGGVNEDKYATVVTQTQLSDSERVALRQSLGKSGKSASGSAKGGARSGNVRSDEDISYVMDQNKSKLYSIYRRARRTNPGLKGKIILEITIAPSGKVANVRIKSSQLNDPKLESRLISRIKGIDFGKTNAETVIVTFPIEFLPS